MTFYYVNFFTHKIYLFNGLLFTHSIVKALIFTTFLYVYPRHANIQYSGYRTKRVGTLIPIIER